MLLVFLLFKSVSLNELLWFNTYFNIFKWINETKHFGQTNRPGLMAIWPSIWILIYILLLLLLILQLFDSFLLIWSTYASAFVYVNAFLYVCVLCVWYLFVMNYFNVSRFFSHYSLAFIKNLYLYIVCEFEYK